MKRSKFSEEQITFALRQHDAGTPVEEVCRQLGVSQATFYNWKKKYAHMGVAELRELRQLREENDRLKRLVADLTLDKQILSDVVKKMYGPPRCCKALVDERCSLHKCIRPLASGLMLQPGHDEIRTRRS